MLGANLENVHSGLWRLTTLSWGSVFASSLYKPPVVLAASAPRLRKLRRTEGERLPPRASLSTAFVAHYRTSPLLCTITDLARSRPREALIRARSRATVSHI